MKFAKIRQLVEEASSIENPDFRDPNSLSASSLRTLLKNLASEIVTPESAYVEIGVFRGGTLLDVASATSGKCIGIDNFSLFDFEGINENHIRQRMREEEIENVELVSLDFEVAVHNFGELFPNLKVGLLMVDGAHDYRSQLLALLGMESHMAPAGVIVVDDANYGHVRQAGYDFVFAYPDWEVTCEVLTESHPDRGQKSKWWNGVQILTKSRSGVGQKPLDQPAATPLEVEAIQQLVERFRETHETFRHQLSPVALEVLDHVRDASLEPDLLSTLQKLRGTPSVLSRHTSQNVDVDADQVGIRYRPSAHRARLEMS